MGQLRGCTLIVASSISINRRLTLDLRGRMGIGAREGGSSWGFERECTHVKLRTPRASLVRRPHAAEQLAQPSPTPIRAPRLRRSRAPGLSPERLRVGSRPVRGRCAAARRRHLRDDARGVRHRRRVRTSGAAAGIRTAALVPVPVSCPHRPADSGRRPRRPWGGRDGGQVVIEIHVQRLERGFRWGGLRVRRHRWHRRPDTLRPLRLDERPCSR